MTVPDLSPTPRSGAGRGDATSSVELAIGGMTCASCAARIEKKLNRLDGVTAAVNYATEKATVSFPETVRPDELIAVVEQTGYTASVPRPAVASARRLRRRVAGDEPRGRAGGAAAAADRQRRAVGAGGAAGDGPRLAVHVLAVAVAHPGRTGGRLGWLAVPPGRLDQPAARRRHHGHPGVAGHACRLRVVPGRPVLRHGRDARHAARDRVDPVPGRRTRLHLPGGRRRRHHLHPGRPLHRGPLEAAGRCGAAGAARAGVQGRRRAAGRRRGPDRDRAAGGRRRVRGPTRRGDRHRRHRGAGQLGGGHVDADRRVRTGRGRAGRPRGRRLRERRRTTRRPRHPGRFRHPARPDGPAGGGGPDRQGPGAAAGRPDLRHLRPDRHRARRGHPRFLARARRRSDRRLHRRDRGVDHRLPVRPRAGHARWR